MKKCALIVLPLLWLGCGHAPQTHYYLIEVAGPKKSEAKKDLVLWLKDVSADAVHTQDRLIYRTSVYEVQFDPYRRWALTPAEMIKQSALDYLAGARLFKQVSEILPGSEQPYWALELTIRQFEEYVTPGRRSGRVQINGQVREGSSGQVFWEGACSAESAIQGADATAIVQAMSAATEKALQQLVEQLSRL